MPIGALAGSLIGSLADQGGESSGSYQDWIFDPMGAMQNTITQALTLKKQKEEQERIRRLLEESRRAYAALPEKMVKAAGMEAAVSSQAQSQQLENAIAGTAGLGSLQNVAAQKETGRQAAEARNLSMAKALAGGLSLKAGGMQSLAGMEQQIVSQRLADQMARSQLQGQQAGASQQSMAGLGSGLMGLLGKTGEGATDTTYSDYLKSIQDSQGSSNFLNSLGNYNQGNQNYNLGNFSKKINYYPGYVPT